MNYGVVMIANPQCPEGRQHISLSNYAYSIIKSDSQTFMGTINYSGFINRIVLNSMLESFDELEYAEDERICTEFSKYSKPGRSTHITESERELINRIAIAHRNYQLASFAQYSKDVPLKIRLNRELHDILYPLHSDWSGIKYNISQGDYIKSLVEEYSRKTIFNREGIFFKKRIEELDAFLDSAKEDKQRLQLTLTSGLRFILKPYRISFDYEADYHYIVGMSAKEGSKDFIPVSFRISRIEKFSPRSISSGSGRITEKERNLIEQKIKDNGIAYMLGEPVEHVIKLTPNGMNMYNSIIHQRPVYDHPPKVENGFFIMTITATERQITNYFFTFANDAEIISPQKTREWMLDRYSSAFDSYNNSLG